MKTYLSVALLVFLSNQLLAAGLQDEQTWGRVKFSNGVFAGEQTTGPEILILGDSAKSLFESMTGVEMSRKEASCLSDSALNNAFLTRVGQDYSCTHTVRHEKCEAINKLPKDAEYQCLLKVDSLKEGSLAPSLARQDNPCEGQEPQAERDAVALIGPELKEKTGFEFSGIPNGSFRCDKYSCYLTLSGIYDDVERKKIYLLQDVEGVCDPKTKLYHMTGNNTLIVRSYGNACSK